jgi:hypothetical protein
MYIGGTFTNWAPNIAMKLEGDIWIAEAVRIPPGNHEFKFANSTDWSKDDWGDAQGFSGVAKRTTGGGPNIRISVPQGGFYRVMFNDRTLEYSLQEVSHGIYGNS